jgi:SAM-dependent methyltransferase
MDNQKHWNIDQTRISENKIQSAYAESREQEFPRNSHVVDLGGGQGQDAEYFVSRGHTVTLIDFSDVALQKAQERASKLEEGKLKIAKAILGEETLPLAPASQDVVYSRLTLQYFDRTKTLLIFKQIKECLKPGGKAFIAIKSPDDIQNINFLKQTAQEVDNGVFNDRGQIKSRFNKAQWESILSEADISNFSIKTITEDMSGRGDKTKSGNTQLLLTEIEFTS